MTRAEARRVLGLSGQASPSEIRRAYRRLVLREHPDRNPRDPEAASRLRRVIEAYETLSAPPPPAAPPRKQPQRDPFAPDVVEPPPMESFAADYARMKRTPMPRFGRTMLIWFGIGFVLLVLETVRRERAGIPPDPAVPVMEHGSWRDPTNGP